MKYWEIVTEGNERCSLFLKAESVEKIGYGTILINNELEIKTQNEVIEIRNSKNPI